MFFKFIISKTKITPPIVCEKWLDRYKEWYISLGFLYLLARISVQGYVHLLFSGISGLSILLVVHYFGHSSSVQVIQILHICYLGGL